MTRRVTFQFMVPVHVEVEDGVVNRVIVLDESALTAPTFVDGDRGCLQEAVAESENGQSWPAWQFGY